MVRKGKKKEKIVCFGGAGSIGSELVRQLVVDNEVLIFDIDETRTFDLWEELERKGHDVYYRIGDVRDEVIVKKVIDTFKPDIIFHASAYKHVSPMELYPMEAIKTNIIGAYNIINNFKGKIVNISTDKVINANCIMGATKKVAEIMVRNAGGISVRFGNVLGSRGSVIPIWQRQVDNDEPITITDERMERYMMTIPQACELVIKASEIGKPGQILIMDMGKQVKILDLAKEIIEKSGKDIKIKNIGIRPGETLSEKLMTEDEEARAVKIDKFYII
jgi:FlaA1/EpsC-like NDP-sugar epimerase